MDTTEEDSAPVAQQRRGSRFRRSHSNDGLCSDTKAASSKSLSRLNSYPPSLDSEVSSQKHKQQRDVMVSNNQSKEKRRSSSKAPRKQPTPKEGVNLRSATCDRAIVVAADRVSSSTADSTFTNGTTALQGVNHKSNHDMPRTLDFFPTKDASEFPEVFLFNMNGSKFGSLDLQTAEDDDPTNSSSSSSGDRGSAEPTVESLIETATKEIQQQQPLPFRLIEGSPGSRIRAILGATGRNFLLLIDEDDGVRTWQSKSWAGLPPSLEAKLREVGYVFHCSVASNGHDWFLSGRCARTQTTQNWWVSDSKRFNAAMEDAIDKGLEVRVAFGDMSIHQYIILLGQNGYSLGEHLPEELVEVLDNIYRDETNIARVRGLSARGVFLVEECVDDDNDADEASMVSSIVRSVYHAQGLSQHLQSALEAFVENQQDLHEVAIGTEDSSWLVIRDEAWDGSIGIHDDLASGLDQFYSRHMERQRLAQEKVSLFNEERRLEEQLVSLRMAEIHRLQNPRHQATKPRKKTKGDYDEEERASRRSFATQKRQDRLERHKKFVFETNEASRRKRDKEDRITELLSKRIQPGDYVTVAGVSTKFGDVKLESIESKTGIVRIRLPPAAIKRRRRKSGCSSSSHASSVNKETIIPIHDVRRLGNVGTGLVLSTNLEFATLVGASDKYEAAMILYHAFCNIGSCACKREYFGFSQKNSQAERWKIGDRVHVKGYSDGTIVGTSRDGNDLHSFKVQYDDESSYHVLPDQIRAATPSLPLGRCHFLQPLELGEENALRIRPVFESLAKDSASPFDNFHCSEKIDWRNLQRVVADLRSDFEARKSLLDDFTSRIEQSPDNSNYEVCRSILERCRDVEETVYSFWELLKGQPVDEYGCIVHRVQYRHRDAAYRGRLFAVGHRVRLLEQNFPRTLTLQGVQHDLLASLCGAFCHYIDCENSEVAILCSLAKQLGLDSLIPTLNDYCAHRNKWIDAIQQQHQAATHDEVKRLVNIILNGGSYHQWLQQVNEESVNKVRRFAFRLEAEAKIIRDQLLQHPRFHWTQIERDYLRMDASSNDETMKSILYQRILHSCENEVLQIMHRTFNNKGWLVRAKIFDSVLIECGSKSEPKNDDMSVKDTMRVVEKICAEHGWSIKLVEKPLFGLQGKQIVAAEEARAILHAVQRAQVDDNEGLDDLLDEMSRTSAETQASIQLM